MFAQFLIMLPHITLVALVVVVTGKSLSTLPDPEKLLGKGVQVSAEHLVKLRQQFQILNDYQQSLNRGEVPLTLEEAKKKVLDNKTHLHSDDARFYFFQGDILLSVEQAEYLVGSHLEGGIQTVPQRFWDPKVPIPYYFDSSLSTAALSSIPKSIAFWQENTCLNFTYSTTQPQRLRFFAGSGCYSNIGKQFRQTSQDVSIGRGCEGFGTVTHEIAHALGLFHEQSRPDRDQYLKINFDNIIDDLEYNFVKNTPQDDNSYGIAYDYGSVMQYGAYAFAINNAIPTLTAIDSRYQNLLGQRESPAFSDVKTMNRAYCSDKCANTKTVCYNYGYPHPRDCTKCMCPRYFGGRDCSQLAVGNAPICNGGYLTPQTNWLSLTGNAGMNNYSTTATPVDCFWQITAPANRKVQLRLRTPLAQCSEQCTWQGLDVNLGSFDLAGLLACCNTNGAIWTTTGNVAVIRAMSRYNIASFVMDYRYY